MGNGAAYAEAVSLLDNRFYVFATESGGTMKRCARLTCPFLFHRLPVNTVARSFKN